MNMTVKPFGGFGRETAPGRRISSSDAEMNLRARSLLMSRLEMAEALQSRLTLAASEALAPFFFPMVLEASEGRMLEEGEDARRR